jgi:hypothetical protein
MLVSLGMWRVGAWRIISLGANIFAVQGIVKGRGEGTEGAERMEEVTTELAELTEMN